MNRITDEDVLYAYMLTGWKPCTGYWYRPDKQATYACPLMAVLGALCPDLIPQAAVRYSHAFLSLVPGIEYAYAVGFLHGVDSGYSTGQGKLFQQGYEDGAAIVQHLRQHGGVAALYLPMLTFAYGDTSTAATSTTKMTFTTGVSASTATTITWTA